MPLPKPLLRWSPICILSVLLVGMMLINQYFPQQGLVLTASAEEHGNKVNGATLFHERGCEHCHGVNGSGGELGPDLSAVGKRKKRPEIEHQIVAGGGGMPAFGEALQPEEIKDLVEFLALKRKAQTSVSPAAQAVHSN